MLNWLQFIQIFEKTWMILSEFLVMHVAGLNFKYIVVFVSGSKDLKFSNQTYLYFFRYKKQHLCVDASKSYGMAT